MEDASAAVSDKREESAPNSLFGTETLSSDLRGIQISLRLLDGVEVHDSLAARVDGVAAV